MVYVSVLFLVQYDPLLSLVIPEGNISYPLAITPPFLLPLTVSEKLQSVCFWLFYIC